MPRTAPLLLCLALFLCAPALPSSGQELTVTDSLGRSVSVPSSPERLIASGSGALRLVVYLQAQDRIVATDSAEKPANTLAALRARPYSLANPQFADLPLFGEFRGMDSPELIAGLNPRPQVIFKVSPLAGPSPDDLTAKTGIPVVGFEYGNLTDKRGDLYTTLRLMGRILGREQRAEEVISFFEGEIGELRARTEDIPEKNRPSCYIGGVAFRGGHGFASTEPGYAPFVFAGGRNIAGDLATGKSENIQMSREKLLADDPEVIFIDLNTLAAGEEANALSQLAADPALKALSAVRKGSVWGVLPYNAYTANYGSIIANAWFIGKTLYPERFADIDPAAKADEIYTFLVGKPVFPAINDAFSGLVFSPLEGAKK